MKRLSSILSPAPSACLSFTLLFAGYVGAVAQAADEPAVHAVALSPEVVEAMTAVHAGFRGSAGRVAQFGDSITYSMAFWSPMSWDDPQRFLTRDDGLPKTPAKGRWRDVIQGARDKGPKFGNYSGWRVGNLLKSIDAVLARDKPEAAIIMIGTNDVSGNRVPADYRAGLETVVEKCLRARCVPILNTIPPRRGHESSVEAVNAIIREVAAKRKLPLADYHAACLRLRPGKSWDGTLISKDGVHPGGGKTNDYSPANLKTCGYALRNWVNFLALRQLHFRVFEAGPGSTETASGESPVTPAEPTPLFNGKDFAGLYTWLRATGPDDPQKVFTVKDGAIHMKGGEHRGVLVTKRAYKDYRVSVEYKWGEQTDGGKWVRNSGLLVHGAGADGGAGRNAWMAGLEIQLAQGCEGDLIVIRGKDEKGGVVKVDLATHVRIAPDKKTRWDPKGKKVKYAGRQFWWKDHMPFFKELLDTRGDEDVASAKGEWTKVEAICRGDVVTVKINGVTVNQAVDVFPAAGKILLQNEGHEVYFRNFMVLPLKKTK